MAGAEQMAGDALSHITGNDCIEKILFSKSVTYSTKATVIFLSQRMLVCDLHGLTRIFFVSVPVWEGDFCLNLLQHWPYGFVHLTRLYLFNDTCRQETDDITLNKCPRVSIHIHKHSVIIQRRNRKMSSLWSSTYGQYKMMKLNNYRMLVYKYRYVHIY